MTGKQKGCGCAAVGSLFVLAFLGFALPLDFLIAVFLGWGFYLGRVGPEIRVTWESVALAVVLLAIFAVGSHTFLTWLYTQLQTGEKTPKPWPRRWSAVVVSLILLMFVSGIAAIGVIHQSGWLLRSKEPLVESGGGAREAARRSQSTNNLKEIGRGLYNYESEYGFFPPGGTFDAIGRGRHGWQASILPYIEERPLYNTINFAQPWDHASNSTAYRTTVSRYLNPSFVRSYERFPKPEEGVTDPEGHPLTHYSGNALVLGGEHPRKMEEIPDGASTTILAGEVAAQFVPWGTPTNWRDPALGINRSSAGFGSAFGLRSEYGGATMLFADGSVKWLKNSIDPRVLKALSTPAGGETVHPEDY
jgi:prepilin-type processing-associated H-X9-DG protein